MRLRDRCVAAPDRMTTYRVPRLRSSRADRLMTQPMEVADQILATVVDRGTDQVAAPFETERAQALLIRNIQPDVLRTQLLVHPPDACPRDIGQRATCH